MRVYRRMKAPVLHTMKAQVLQMMKAPVLHMMKAPVLQMKAPAYRRMKAPVLHMMKSHLLRTKAPAPSKRDPTSYTDRFSADADDESGCHLDTDISWDSLWVDWGLKVIAKGNKYE